MNKRIKAIMLSAILLCEASLALPVQADRGMSPTTKQSATIEGNPIRSENVPESTMQKSGLPAVGYGICKLFIYVGKKAVGAATYGAHSLISLLKRKKTDDSKPDSTMEDEQDAKASKIDESKLEDKVACEPEKIANDPSKSESKYDMGDEPRTPKTEVNEHSYIAEPPRKRVKTEPRKFQAKKPDSMKHFETSVCLDYPVPLRAIKWRKNLCWFNSSILMFYHKPEYNKTISTFPTDEARAIMQDLSEDDPVAKTLKAMIHLQEIFQSLSGDKNTPSFKLPKVIRLNDCEAFISELRDFCKYNHVCLSDDIQLRTDGSFCTLCGSILYRLINSAKNVCITQPGDLHNWAAQAKKCMGNNPIHISDRYFKNDNPSAITIKGQEGHFWLHINHREYKIDIGLNLDDDSAILVHNKTYDDSSDESDASDSSYMSD